MFAPKMLKCHSKANLDVKLLFGKISHLLGPKGGGYSLYRNIQANQKAESTFDAKYF